MHCYCGFVFQIEVEKKILRVARSLFSKRGVRDVTVDEICHALGISKKTFYQYYGSKEELVGKMIDLHLSEIRNTFESSCAGKSCIEIIAFALNQKVMGGNYMITEKIGRDIEKYYNDIFVEHTKKTRDAAGRDILAFLKKGVEEGVFRSDIDMEVALVLFFIVHEAFSRYVKGELPFRGRKKPKKAIVEASKDMLMHYILTEKGWNELNQIDNNKEHKDL